MFESGSLESEVFEASEPASECNEVQNIYILQPSDTSETQRTVAESHTLLPAVLLSP